MPELDSHLKELILTILDEREKAGAAAWRTVQVQMEKLNDLRKEVIEDRGTFVKRELHEQMYETMTQRINKLESGYARIMGAVAVLVLIAGALGTVVGSIMSHIFK